MTRFLHCALVAVSMMFAGNAFAQDSQDVVTRGKNIYEQNCLACHQADGSGVPGLAPPLAKGMFVEGDKRRLIEIILHGLEGVEIRGESYANPMPAFDYMSDEEVADLLTYVRNSFTNRAEPITPGEVKEIRKKSP